MVPTLSQMNLVQILKPYLRSILILDYQVSSYLPYAPFITQHAYYMPYPPHPTWFKHPNNIWWGVQSYEAPHHKNVLQTIHTIAFEKEIQNISIINFSY
jgi:hypothetical protein